MIRAVRLGESQSLGGIGSSGDLNSREESRGQSVLLDADDIISSRQGAGSEGRVEEALRSAGGAGLSDGTGDLDSLGLIGSYSGIKSSRSIGRDRDLSRNRNGEDYRFSDAKNDDAVHFDSGIVGNSGTDGSLSTCGVESDYFDGRLGRSGDSFITGESYWDGRRDIYNGDWDTGTD